MRIIRLLGSASLLMCLALPASATEVYKWTDEQGGVHYTQSPPPADVRHNENLDLNIHHDDARGQRELEQLQQKAEQQREDRLLEEEEERKQAQTKAEQERACKQAKEISSRLERIPRATTTDEQGNVRRLTEEELDARRVKARADVEKYCAGL